MAVVLAIIAVSSIPAKADNKPGQGDLVGHGGPVKALATSPDGAGIVSGSFDYSMMYWNVTDAAKPAMVKRFSDHDGAVNAVAVLPDGRHAVTGSDDGMVRLLDLRSGAIEHVFRGHDHKVVGVALSPDGTLAVSASWDRTVRIWSLTEKRQLHVLQGHRNTVNAAVFSQTRSLSIPPALTPPSVNGGSAMAWRSVLYFAMAGASTCWLPCPGAGNWPLAP